MKRDVQLLIIDPQTDFCDPSGALYVPGADRDADRLADLVVAAGACLSRIHVTLDTHHFYGIERPSWWRYLDGRDVLPFTTLGLSETRMQIVRYDGERPTTDQCVPRAENNLSWAFQYLADLDKIDRRKLTIWPAHCVIGTPGWTIVPRLAEAIGKWEVGANLATGYVLKGLDPRYEQLSTFRPEGVALFGHQFSPSAEALRTSLGRADVVVVAGEALSHCVAATVRDLVCLDHGLSRRLVLLTDAMSIVPGFEGQGRSLLEAMQVQGARALTIEQFQKEVLS